MKKVLIATAMLVIGALSGCAIVPAYGPAPDYDDGPYYGTRPYYGPPVVVVPGWGHGHRGGHRFGRDRGGHRFGHDRGGWRR